MSIEDRNAVYIRQLNQNLIMMDLNIQSLSDSVKELAKNSAAMQQAVIAYMTEKGIIGGPEDARLFQKLHMRQIAQLDQELAKKEEDNR